jgi:hypothetical protein
MGAAKLANSLRKQGRNLDNLFHGAGTDATGANISALNFAVQFKPDFLQVRQPAVTGQIVSMADPVTILGAFAAYRALPAHGTPPTSSIARVEIQGAGI